MLVIYMKEKIIIINAITTQNRAYTIICSVLQKKLYNVRKKQKHNCGILIAA